MPRAKTKDFQKGRVKSASKRKEPTRLRNGVPLKRKVVWVYDRNSPEFQAMVEREIDAIKKGPEDPGIDAFLEAALADAAEKWWR